MISHDILIIHPDNRKHGPFLNMSSMKRQAVDCMSGTSHLKISRTHKFHHESSTNLAVLPESGTAPKKSWSRRDWRLWGLWGAHNHHDQPWPSHQTTINAWNQMLTANKQHSQLPNTLFWPVSRKTRGLTSSPQISTSQELQPQKNACKGIEMPSLFAGNTASSAKECKHQTSVQLCCWAKLGGFAGKPSSKQG